MRISKALAVGVVLVLVAVTATIVPLAMHGRRSVQRVSALPPPPPPPPFNPAQSAALFVGVSKFTHDEVAPVTYAVDDAVDLAYEFTFDMRVHLVEPSHVVLALSGKPVKVESEQRLRELEQAGVQIKPADQSDILALLHKQAAVAGKSGMLIVSLATHGFARDGVGYVLGASSLVRFPETNLSTAKLLDIIAASEAQRSLVFVDACRERLLERTRAAETDPVHALSILYGRMKRTRGQAIFYAAPAGRYAFDGDGNGVFTKAVLEGLRCNASAPRSVVTAETLATFVNRNVRDWIRKNHDPSAAAGIQWSFDGDAKNMPLALCWQPPGRIAGGIAVARVSVSASTLVAFDENGARLWSRRLDSAIARAEVVDLDADNRPEVVAATRQAVVAFDSAGNLRWSVNEDGLPLREIAIGDVFRKHTREVVALWDAGAASSRLSVYAPDGQRLSTSTGRIRFEHVAIDRPTSHHAPKIIATGASLVALFHPKKIGSGKPEWSSRIAGKITRLRIVDYDQDGRNDIAIETANGRKVFLDFDGNVLGRADD